MGTVHIHKAGLLFILAIAISLVANATHPEKLIMKAEKLAVKNFRDSEIVKEPIHIDPSVYYNEQADTVFRLIQKEGELMGYLVLSSAMDWLKQFLDNPVGTEYTYGQNIDAISGATFSGKSLTNNINRLNILISTYTK